MIISVNPKPSVDDFNRLMVKTDSALNADAASRPAYYAGRGGHPLEDDVKDVLEDCAKGTPFEGTIEKVSGQRFPDIVAAKLYGVEVKSTKGDHWTSTGSSILETTRVTDVERIYMTFGKLGGRPIEFRSRPYEECLYDIAVTHMPRYLIDMRLKEGETIFDKMGVPYDTLRKMDNPTIPIARYYKGLLKPGERLWWTGDPEEETVSAKLKLWSNLNPPQKRFYMIYACVNFPEVFGGTYDSYALWLASQGIVDPHIRDQFSAGGKENMKLPSGAIVRYPGVYRRVKENADLLIRRMRQQDTSILFDTGNWVSKEVFRRRLGAWIKRVSENAPVDTGESIAALTLFYYSKYADILN